MKAQAVRRMIFSAAAVVFTVCAAAQAPRAEAQSPRQKHHSEEPADSIVRLIQADTLQIETIAGRDYRKVFGHPARFLHNGTYLLCDKAVWDVTGETLDAQDHVSIIQDGTTLTSDRMFYRINEDLAEFRGTLVQLEDKDGNTLRTKNLDYNTKDSVAVFRYGGSMRDKDGNIIESVDGTYEARAKTFLFENEVDMFTDSVFVKTPRLLYDSDRSLANFYEKVNMWQEDRMLSSRTGWYDSKAEIFFFDNNVHALTEKQEAWCDSLYFFRKTGDFEMNGHVQVLDTARNTIALAGHMNFVDSLTRLTMLKNPAIVALVENDNPRALPDSVFMGADTIIYVSQYRFKVDSLVAQVAEERLKEVDVDPVSQLREQAAAAAREAAAKAAEDDPNNAANAAKRAEEYAAKQAAETEAFPEEEESLNLFQRIKIKIRERKSSKVQKATAARADSTIIAEPPATKDTLALKDTAALKDTLKDTQALKDTLEVQDALEVQDIPGTNDALATNDTLAVNDTPAVSDTLAINDTPAVSDTLAIRDSLAVNDSLTAKIVDSTRIAFVTAIRNVKIFRENMQVRCDSLEYSDLDSLARLFKSPKIWNEGRHQYIADSVYAVVNGGAMEKAHLLSNAFVHIQEDTLLYDQIRSAEMTAYFHEDGTIRRFDALGDATALFYIQENDVFATSNHKECRMLSANFKNGNIERVHYYEGVKSDATPVAQMKKEDKVIKGFAWTPEERPASRYDITAQKVRKSERMFYVRYPKADYSFTKQYFPGYIENIHKEIRERRLLREQRERERKLAEQRRKELEALSAADTLGKAVTDSLTANPDTSAVRDSLAAVKDSVVASVSDSVSVKTDSAMVTTAADATPAAVDRKAEKAEAKAARKAERESAAKARAEAKKEKQQLAQARWDAKEAERLKKIDAKKQARQEKLRKKKLKALRRQAEIEKGDAELRNKYIEKLK